MKPIPRNVPSRLPILILIGISTFGSVTSLSIAESPSEKSVEGPYGLRVSVKMIGPVVQPTDLQIICILKHDPAGDKYIEAMKDLNAHLGHLLSSVRDRGEFAGEPGETFLFDPPSNLIKPARVLLIGVGDESTLALDRLRLVGRVAAREAVRLKAAHVSFAPTLRDQGSTRIDVGEGDAAVAEQFALAYDSEQRMQAQGLSPKCELKDFTIEAGPKFFDGVVRHVAAAIESASIEIKQRDSAPYAASQSGKQ